MLKQVKLDEAVGKVFKQKLWKYDDTLLLIFKDDTIVVIAAHNEQYDEPAQIVWDIEFNPKEFNAAELVEAGVCTQEELDKIYLERKTELDKYTEQQERTELERLKRKYPDA